MIKFPPSGTTVRFSTGLKHAVTKAATGRLGEGARECGFSTPLAEIQAYWKDEAIELVLRASASLYVREVILEFSFSSTKPAGLTAVWTDSSMNDLNELPASVVPGALSVKETRTGSGALWIAEEPGADGVLFYQPPGAGYPVSFTCKMSGRTLIFVWRVGRTLGAEESLKLSPVGISRGPRLTTTEAWIQKWKRLNKRTLDVNQSIGWFTGGLKKPDDDLKNTVGKLHSAQIPVHWIASEPVYASERGDWLNLDDNETSSISRVIAENGYLPAIRLAPFILPRRSASAEKHKEWFVTEYGGSQVSVGSYRSKNDTFWVLDLTNPEVENHVGNALKTLRDRLGFRVFVLEHLNDVAVFGNRSSECSPGELLRKTGELARKALGDKTCLIASGMPTWASGGDWDAMFVAPYVGLEGKLGSHREEAAHLSIGSTLLHRSVWNKAAGGNAVGPLKTRFFDKSANAGTRSLLAASALSADMIVFGGKPDIVDDSVMSFLKIFASCRTRRLRLSENTEGGRRKPLIVRSESGWLGVFNMSEQKMEVVLKKDELHSAVGLSKHLSDQNGAVFHSPEVVMSLPARGHKLFS